MFFGLNIRVATDLENLEKSGILKETSNLKVWEFALKIREFAIEFQNSVKSQGIFKLFHVGQFAKPEEQHHTIILL